jgi:hypothetical protein
MIINANNARFFIGDTEVNATSDNGEEATADDLDTMSRAVAEWCKAMVPLGRALAAGVARALVSWERATRPLLTRQQIGIYAKPTTKKIRKMIRAMQ